MPFFFGDRGLNPKTCIYYVLSLSTKLSSRGLYMMTLKPR